MSLCWLSSVVDIIGTQMYSKENTLMDVADIHEHLLFFDRECPACGPLPDSSLFLHHSRFIRFVQLTIDGAELGAEVPPGGIVWH